jgi:outer membrane cobalamin receptor
VELYVKGYLHDWDTDYFPVTDPADSAYWGYKDFGLSAATRLNLTDGLEYHLGYDFQNYRGRDDFLLIEEMTEKAHAFYGQIRTTDDLSSRARFTAGLRFNDVGSKQATVWSTSGVFNLTDSLYVEGTLGTSFLLPDAYQLFAIDPFDTRGNPDLEPEESFNINLALGGKLEAGSRPVSWQVSAWKRRVKNLIVDDDTNPPAGFDTVFINIDEKVKMSGFELLARGDLSDAFSFTTSYMNSRERTASGARLTDRPRHSAKVGLGYAPAGQAWGVDVALKYAGAMYTGNLNGFGVQSYGDMVVANLGAHWFPDGASRNHRIGIRIENLFDEDYATRIRSAALAGSTTGQRLLYSNLGAPRTAFLNYSYDF